MPQAIGSTFFIHNKDQAAGLDLAAMVVPSITEALPPLTAQKNRPADPADGATTTHANRIGFYLIRSPFSAETTILPAFS